MKTHTLKLFLFLLFVLVSACETRPVKPADTTISGEQTAPVTEEQASLTEQAQQLVQQAEDSDSFEEQAGYRLQAARLYLQAGNLNAAKQQHAIITRLYEGQSLTEAQQAGLDLLSTEIAIKEKNAEQAETLLAETKPVSREQQVLFYALKADLDHLNGRYLYAVDRRVQLEAYITDPEQKKRNHRKIWAALSSIPGSQLKQQSSRNVTIQGWLELARVMRSGQKNISQLEDSLLDWGTRNPGHPAAGDFLQELVGDYQQNLTAISHIAVILPMQGKLAPVSTTIRNGILSAYYQGAGATEKPRLQFYDSSDDSVTFHQLYLQAIDNGASNIIGPLNKIEINRLAQQYEMDIPVLTLNYAENAFNHTRNLYQFGLSPEDEARQVAELAIHQNRKTAAVFYPDSEWGNRLNEAFSQHYESLGGKVLTRANYATNTNDYRRPIRALLNLDQSAIRRRKVENTISRKTQSEPYRRRDIDMIFMAATHRSARSIMPAFKFHHAGDLPVYATSHVYTGKLNRELDRDLNGLVFCDMPWVLKNNSPLSETFRRNWPQQQNLTRLFALGIDAYHLIYNLDYLQNRDYAVYEGQTGSITLDEYNRVHRRLLWARFERGIAVPFEPEVVTDADIAN